ncbi:MAG: hypothetical protein ACLFQA_00625 [Bacteroidales bacterium]
MDGKERFKELRKLLYKEIQGELSYNEKKEFLNECIDEHVIAKLQEKYLRRKKYLAVSAISYGIFLMVLLAIMLLNAETHFMFGLIILAMVLLPLFISLFFSKAVMGYQKLDLALRLITRFYVKKKMDS